MSFFANVQVVDNVEAQANEELEMDELSRRSTTTEDTSATGQSAEERENVEVDLVHQHGGMEDDAISTASSAERSSTESDATESTSASHAAEAERPMAHLSCRLCSEDENAPEEPLYQCPCRCIDTYVHQSCLEQLLYQRPEGGVCASRVRTLFCFLAYMVFNLGNIGVLTMAWMYVLVEYSPKSWLPTASLALALFVISVFWIGFACQRLSVHFMNLVQWRRDNTTLKVLFTNKVTQA
ncbi:hypothetical protein MRX96_015994 [Rhipicephalus microplus]